MEIVRGISSQSLCLTILARQVVQLFSLLRFDKLSSVSSQRSWLSCVCCPVQFILSLLLRKKDIVLLLVMLFLVVVVLVRLLLLFIQTEITVKQGN